MSSYKFTGILLAVCLVAPFSAAQVPSYRIRTRSVAEVQADQRNLISTWCRLDYEGARLSADGWKKFDAITNMKVDPDYSAIYVVARYDMEPPDHLSMDATVRYLVLGRYQLGIGYTPQSETRLVNFQFSDKDSELQISDVDPPQPNVSKAVFIEWLKTQIAAAKTPSDKLPLQNALNALTPHPAPAPTPVKTPDTGTSTSKPH